LSRDETLPGLQSPARPGFVIGLCWHRPVLGESSGRGTAGSQVHPLTRSSLGMVSPTRGLVSRHEREFETGYSPAQLTPNEYHENRQLPRHAYVNFRL